MPRHYQPFVNQLRPTLATLPNFASELTKPGLPAVVLKYARPDFVSQVGPTLATLPNFASELTKSAPPQVKLVYAQSTSDGPGKFNLPTVALPTVASWSPTLGQPAVKLKYAQADVVSQVRPTLATLPNFAAELTKPAPPQVELTYAQSSGISPDKALTIPTFGGWETSLVTAPQALGQEYAKPPESVGPTAQLTVIVPPMGWNVDVARVAKIFGVHSPDGLVAPPNVSVTPIPSVSAWAPIESPALRKVWFSTSYWNGPEKFVVVVFSSLTHNYEILATIKTAKGENEEAGGTVKPARTINYEVLGTLKTVRQTNYEVLGTVKQSKVSNYEVLSLIKSLEKSNYEVLSTATGVSRALTTNYEAKGIVKNAVVSNYEALGRVALALKSNYEFLKKLNQNSIVDDELLKGLSLSRVVNYEIKGTVVRQLTSNYEASAKLFRQLTDNYEVLKGAVSQSKVTPYELLKGVAKVAQTFEEARGQIKSLGLSPYEVRVLGLAFAIALDSAKLLQALVVSGAVIGQMPSISDGITTNFGLVVSGVVVGSARPKIDNARVTQALTVLTVIVGN